jgi:hypothetical protein
MSSHTPPATAAPAPPEPSAVEGGVVPFVVGRLGRGDRRLLVLEDETPPPFAGPFELKAVFSK